MRYIVVNNENSGHTFSIVYELSLLCVLSFGIYVLIDIIELHWLSKSHRLRCQVVRSWRGEFIHMGLVVDTQF